MGTFKDVMAVMKEVLLLTDKIDRAGKTLSDLLIGWVGVLAEQGLCCHDKAGGAESALDTAGLCE